MKKIMALAAATVLLSTAGFSQTGQSKSDTATHHKTMKKSTMKKPMKKHTDSSSSMSSSDSSGASTNRP